MFNEVQGVEGEPRRRVLIGDPDPLARQAVALGFRDDPGFSVIASSGDQRELFELARHYRPDVTLIHAGAKEFDGLALCRQIIAADPDARILVLERNPGAERELSALWAGASGVVAKEEGVAGIIHACRLVMNGRLPHSDDVLRLLLERVRSVPSSGAGMMPVKSLLTPREWEVLDLLTEEMRTADIAAALHLSTDTVSSHVKNLMRKLEVHSRAEAVEKGQSLRWPEPAPAFETREKVAAHASAGPAFQRRPS